MENFKFHEVVIAINVGDIAEGDVLLTASGAKAVLKEGVLTWVTTGGYASTPVAVSIENMNELFLLEKNEDKVEYIFSDAVHFLADGLQMTMVVDNREYPVSSYDDLDSIIETQEYFSDVVTAKFIALQSDLEKVYPSVSTEPVIAQDAVAGILADIEELSKSGKKLTAEDAHEILFGFNCLSIPVTTLAEDFEVSPRMIYYILDGTHWAEVHEKYFKGNPDK